MKYIDRLGVFTYTFLAMLSQHLASVTSQGWKINEGHTSKCVSNHHSFKGMSHFAVALLLLQPLMIIIIIIFLYSGMNF